MNESLQIVSMSLEQYTSHKLMSSVPPLSVFVVIKQAVVKITLCYCFVPRIWGWINLI